MLLQKTISVKDAQIKSEKEEAWTFSGYASVFGGVDSYGDTILRGAFRETLDASTPSMFFNHKWDMPIGRWTLLKEDEYGLYVEGELTKGMSLAVDVRAALKHGSLSGLSIGGFVKSEDYTESAKGRVIHRWTRLMEISPVAFPADDAARIDFNTVKSIDFESALPECKTEKDVERLLRDAGLPKWEAMALVSRVRNIVKGRDVPGDMEAKQLDEIASLAKRIAAFQ